VAPSQAVVTAALARHAALRNGMRVALRRLCVDDVVFYVLLILPCMPCVVAVMVVAALAHA
jgi:hypothetical protein